MPAPILATKLYIPPLRSKVVRRRRLIERLNEGLHGKLTLISAPAGFGKTTLISEWIAQSERPTAWLSLDEGDNDPARFLAYLIAALQTVAANIGEAVLSVLRVPQPPSIEMMLTTLLNEITAHPDSFVLVLDDYHVIDAQSVDTAITFLLRHLPAQMHLVIATREHPQLPLARHRTRGELTELRAADLRFTLSEAAGFLNQVMGLNLIAEDVAALEARTEGWIAGLQLAAISMRGHQDATRFIKSFTGSHHFILDYLVEEVLQQQAESIQHFLLCTCILDRLCGSLCDAILSDSSASGQATLEYLEQANLFIVPLDNERRWYRYHHLFADLLRQRLHQRAVSPSGDVGSDVDELHRRASLWYEDNGLEIEAFHHAAAAHDIERAERLMEGNGMPLLFRGAMAPVMNWLESLSRAVLDARPSLWVWYAFSCLSVGQATGIEQKLQAAEAALEAIKPDGKTEDVMGRIASIRAMLAIPHNDVPTMIAQSRRALALLHLDNLSVRTATTWALGYAYQMQGDRAAARDAYTEVITICQASGNIMFDIAATSSLGSLQEADNQLDLAAETYRRVLQLAGDPPLPHANGAYHGLAAISYERNDLDAAEKYGRMSLQLGLQISSIDLPASAGVLLARLKLAQGDADGAIAELVEAERFVRKYNFVLRLPELAAARVLILLHQGDVQAAARLAQAYDIPLSKARVHLAQRDPSAALAVLEPLRQQADEKGWQDERLRVMILRAIAFHNQDKRADALQVLHDALILAEPGGFRRSFLDEGIPMEKLLSEAAAQRMMPDYISQLLAAFETEKDRKSHLSVNQSLIDPLSERELEVLHLLAQGLSNSEIGERLFIALDTVKGHNRRIYDKLHVQRRTEAVARARELGLL